jgi:[ribosomal protein S5]-alanine N-acetyltransferase
VTHEIDLPSRIEGREVALRPAEMRDVPAWARAFVEDPELGPAWGIEEDPGEAELRERVESSVVGPREGKWAELVIADRSSDELLGDVILHSFDWRHERAEVGFWLTPGARGRGAATEGVRLAVAWAFDELGLHRVEMITLPALPHVDRVLALARRLGFREEGVLRERNFERGRRLDAIMLAVLRPDWETAVGG